MQPRSTAGKPGERARDEARNDHHPSFAAGEWEISDQREPDERFGKTRSDGGAPAEDYVRVDKADADLEPDAVEEDVTVESSPDPNPHTKAKKKPRISKTSRR